tara:strand:+ start:1050 stop:1283 length:234 start_codon:yes stop_codon:yes gene_type:complete
MKYYVSSGDMKVIIDRPSVEEAAKAAITHALQNDGVEALGLLVHASERGFSDTYYDEDLFMSTEHILEELGIKDEFE